MLSELCECVQSVAIVLFNVDVNDALGVYDASAGFGVCAARGNYKSHTDTCPIIDSYTLSNVFISGRKTTKSLQVIFGSLDGEGLH